MRKSILLISMLFLAACSNHQDLTQMKFSGTVEITEHVLGVKVPGRVESMSVKEGDAVAKGQLLATLDRYAQVSKDLLRAQALLKVGGNTAQAVEYAQLALDDQRVVSPINGVVLVKTVELGEVVGAGVGILVIGDPQDQWIKIFVPEGIVNQLRMNQSAIISFDGIKKSYQGHVSFIATKAEFTPRNVQTTEERVTQAFAVKVSFDNPDLSIRPGVAADVRFAAQSVSAPSQQSTESTVDGKKAN